MIFAREVVSWQSRLQKFVALSTMEAEYTTIVEEKKSEKCLIVVDMGSWFFSEASR